MIAVYIENSGGKLPKSSLSAISAARSAKEKHGYSRAIGVLIGSDVRAAAEESKSYGLDEVVYVSQDCLENYLAMPYADCLVHVCRELGAKLVLGSSTTRGKDFLPRVAQQLGAAQASDVLEFLAGGGFKRPMYAGNVIAEVELVSEIKVATIRATAFDSAVKSADLCDVRELSCPPFSCSAQKFISFDTVQSERPELTEASIVVSGGRAMKSAENFQQYIAPLADVLGAAIGASRAAVDAGYAPNDWQVGQTGKVVAPNLYLAVGISGAIQHLAGMKDSKVIVAINSDPEAPIFEVADYGLVADLYQAVPELTAELKKVKS